MLNMLCHPKGKYYSLETDEGLNSRETSDLPGETRLLFRGTAKELRLLCQNDQLELILKGNDDAPEKDFQAGEQPGHNATD